MAFRNIIRAVLLAACVGACAPSPLYVANPKTTGTFGEVPRDSRGEPMWPSIRPPVPLPAPPPLVAVPPGIPVTPPPPRN